MKINQPAILPLVMSALIGCAALAQSPTPSLTVGDPWVRATVAQQPATGAFMRLSATQNLRLLEVRSPVAAMVEIHEMKMQGDVMQMRPLPALAVPAGKTVELKPGGYHVMLMDLKQQVKEGDTVPLTLVFEGKDGKRETQDVKAQVRALNSAARPAGHGDHKH